MIGHRTRFQENDDLPLWRGPAVKKKPPFFKARALISLPRVKLCAGLPHKTSVVQIKVKIS